MWRRQRCLHNPSYSKANSLISKERKPAFCFRVSQLLDEKKERINNSALFWGTKLIPTDAWNAQNGNCAAQSICEPLRCHNALCCSNWIQHHTSVVWYNQQPGKEKQLSASRRYKALNSVQSIGCNYQFGPNYLGHQEFSYNFLDYIQVLWFPLCLLEPESNKPGLFNLIVIGGCY